MARYYGGSSGPADWAAMQVQRRDDQIRDLLNMMMQIKDYRNEQAWKQKEWDQGQSDTAWNRGLEEQRAAAQIGADEALRANRMKPEPTLEDQLKKLEAEEEIKARIRAKYDKPGKGESGKSVEAAKSYIGSIEKKYGDAIGGLEKALRGEDLTMTADEAKPQLDNLRYGQSLLAGMRHRLETGQALVQNDWDVLGALNSGIEVVKNKGAYWEKKEAPPVAAGAAMPQGLIDWMRPEFSARQNAAPEQTAIERTAQKGNVKIKVYSRDGGKTWTDAQGNIIPIGK